MANTWPRLVSPGTPWEGVCRLTSLLLSRWHPPPPPTVVARYLVGLLHSRSPSFFHLHKPVAFSTLSSPVRPRPTPASLSVSSWPRLYLMINSIMVSHATVSQHQATPHHTKRWTFPPDTLLSTILGWLGARIMSRSGEQLYVVDKYSDDDPRPLLEIMADPRAFLRFSFLSLSIVEVKMGNAE